MKKLLILIICIFAATYLSAQTPTQIVNATGQKYVYVGSLVMDAFSSANSQKLTIKIIGGSWFQYSNGETTYYISNREGLHVRKVSHGGSFESNLVLKAFQNGARTDFYLYLNPQGYSSFAVSSYSYGYTLTPGYVTITEQSSLPTGSDISSTMPIQPIVITDELGNVGIGTANPNAKLAVNGKIRAQEIKVETVNWPDYVFKEDYKLTSLEEIQKYICENGHLPGIPSAIEAETKGIDLGEMNTKLLEKIEELTLHLIHLHKENVELKSTDLSLKKMLEEQKSDLIKLKAIHKIN